MNNNLIIKTIEHKGVAVTIKVDFDKGELSLVEKVDNAWKTKAWLFQKRGVEYAEGWMNILSAMRIAMEEGFDLLREHKEDMEKKREEQVIDIIQKTSNLVYVDESKI